MKKIKQINNWRIYKYTENDYMFNVVNEEDRFLVKSPDNRIMEDRLTLELAEEFCRENLDLVRKVSKRFS